jgi:membrane protein DedA with SNARE-associated domain
MNELAVQLATYGYPVLFLGVLLENAGIPVPGETAVLLAGFLASPAGGSHFNIVVVILLVLTAAIIGDNAGFWLGHRWARPRLQQGRGFLFLNAKTLELAEGYFAKYGAWTVFLARFITGLRVVGALAAGASGMSWPRFLIANAGGALAWSVTISLLGYFFGHSWELLHKWIGRGGLIILGSVILLVGLPYLLRRFRHLPAGFWDRLAQARVWLGVLVAILEIVCIALLALLAEKDHPTLLDRQIDQWLTARDVPLLNAVATVGTALASFPIVAIVTLLLLAALWYRRRSWRESAALLWAFLASEAAGLALSALLWSHDLEPVYALTFPRSLAGLLPLRALAVFGMAAKLVARQKPTWGRSAGLVAVLLGLLAGFSVFWTQEQQLTEILLEYAAGGIILFAGVWWLEGHASGLWTTSHATEPGR